MAGFESLPVTVAVFLILASVVHSQDAVGLVFIGENENDTSTVFSFNENYVGVPGQNIPVYVGIFNSSTGEEIPIETPEFIDLTCELRDGTQLGFTDSTFTTERINILNTVNAAVDFTNVVPGRPAEIQCWGESFAPNGVFSKETSISSDALFEIRPAGTANILTSVVVVPNTDSTTQKEEFIVQLTETVESENVTVSCTQEPPGTMVLAIPDAVVLIGRDRAVMEVSVTSKGDGRILVNCTADSLNNGPQFQSGTGQGALFLLDEAEVALIPLVTDLYYPQMTAYLVLDASPESEVTYYCNLTEVGSVDEAKAIEASPECVLPDDISQPAREPVFNDSGTEASTPPTGLSSTTTDASANRTSGTWQLSTDTIVFATDDARFKTLRITRTNRYQPVKPELVAVKCCAPPELSSNPKYNNTNAAFLAIAYVTEEKSINWTLATDDASDEVESEVIDTAYVELGPCPCDLTENACDTDCCCDEDCSVEDIALFSCIPSYAGGQGGEDPRYRCSSQYFPKPDWFPIMCVETENSGFLGLYRQPINATRDDESYGNLADEVEFSSFEENSNRFDDTSAEARDPYVEGFAVKTGIRSAVTGSGVDISNYFRLTIPQRTWSGQCVTAAPVRYLVDSETECVREVRESMCADFTRLGARIYAQSSGIWENQAAPQVLQENAQTTITLTNTNYFCLTDEEVQNYIGKTVTRKQVFGKDQPYYFDNTPDNFTDCDFNAQTGAYVCGDLVFEADDDATVSYTRCPWDDGFTQAPAPSLDSSANISICDNAVVDVLYNFTWKGSEIERLDATILLGNIPLEVEKTEEVVIDHVVGGNVVTETFNETTLLPSQLTQMFKVKWTHRLNESIERVAEEDTDVYERSGKPGYNFNLPVFSGVDARNETTDEFLYMDTNASKSLSLWNPSVSGLCEGASRAEINFGVDAQSSCMLRLGLSDLLDCEALRKSVLYQQDNLMISNYISEGGDPNKTDIDAWLSVFREDISSIITAPDRPGDTTEFTTDFTTNTVPVTTSEDEADGNETLSYVDELIGRCTNVPASVHVDVMYALVGKIEYVPIYQVLGAKISYGLRTWSLQCSGKDGAACTEEAIEALQSQVQTFTVSSSVAFTQIPARIPEPLTEFEQRQLVNRSSRDVCYQEKCWAELLYPVSAAYTGESFTYTLKFSLTVVLLIIGYLIVLRPVYVKL